MKRSTIQIIRRISQIITFILFTGMFSLAFSGIGALYRYAAGMDKDASGLSMFVVPLAAVTVLTLLFGRFFCGWLCAFGTLNDFIHLAAKKLFKNKLTLKVNSKLDAILKYFKYAILLFIVIFVWTLSSISLSNISPWTAFSQAGDFAGTILRMPASYIMLFLVLAGSVLVERFFCRYLCPLGAVLGLLSKLKFTRIHKPGSECSSCRACTNSCPMGINLAAVGRVDSGECIYCLRCVEVCPRSNAQIGFLGMGFDRVSYVISTVIVFAVINLTGMWASSVVKMNNASAQSAIVSQNIEGTVQEAAPTGQASQEESTASDAAAEQEIQQALSEDADKTPGAAAPTETPSTAPIETPTTAPTTAPATPTLVPQKEASANKLYKDGVYEGVADGWSRNLTVKVSVKNDLIASIEIVSHRESRGFYEEPFRIVPQEIIDSQSTNVDAVSGATYTSFGIMNAVADALSKAGL